ncbi:hypothetical protein [Rhizobium mongolense]|uniref:hypothetical protein n=1 Tax=Rhizobium mongolense TaxID=57676 RepID=UPI001ABF65D9|nr:hypothetical protein [Rhizobium mongolense]
MGVVGRGEIPNLIAALRSGAGKKRRGAYPEDVRGILEVVGSQEITIQSHDEKVSSDDLDAMTWELLKVGPLGKPIRENPALQVAAGPLLREALAALGDLSRCSFWLPSGSRQREPEQRPGDEPPAIQKAPLFTGRAMSVPGGASEYDDPAKIFSSSD